MQRLTAVASSFLILAGGTRLQESPSAAAVTGRVVDAAGRPVPGTFVSALFPSSRWGPGGDPTARRFSVEPTEFATVTNALGEFRLNGSTRPFYLIAIPNNRLTSPDAVRRDGHATTYFPSALTPDEARLIRSIPGRPVSANVVLRPARVAIVSGQVFTASGAPARGGEMDLAHLDGLHGFDTRAVELRADGTFEIRALQPGGYFLQNRESGSAKDRPSEWKVSRARFRVADRDVDDVRVEPAAMIRVTGRVVAPPAEHGSLTPPRMQIAAWSVDETPGPQSVGSPRADWTFEFFTWPCTARIKAVIQASVGASPWTVKAIRLDGADVTDRDVTFVQGKHLTGIEVELVRR